MKKIFRSLNQDALFKSVLKNSAYLFSGTTLSAGMNMLQGILSARLIGIYDVGVAAAILTFASNVNRLLSFRMSEVVVKSFGEAWIRSSQSGSTQREPAAVIKAIGLTEAVTSLAAYGLLVLLSPWAAQVFAKDASLTPWFWVYGLVLLANLVYETSSGVLQTARRFDRIAAINLAQSVITLGLIVLASLMQKGLPEVLLAYLIGKSFAGLAIAVSAWAQLGKMLGPGWWKVSLKELPDWRKLARFAINTNLHGTVNLLVRDSEPLFINALLSPAEGGYYNIAARLINLVMIPVDPLIAPTYTELIGTITRREWQAARRLIRRVSALAAAWVLLAGGGLALTGWWLIPFLYTPAAAPAYPAFLVLLVGYGFASVFPWDRPLLLTFGMAGFPLKVMLLAGLVKTILTLWLTPTFGYLCEAGLLSAFFVSSISVIVWRGWRELKTQSAADLAAGGQPDPGAI